MATFTTNNGQTVNQSFIDSITPGNPYVGRGGVQSVNGQGGTQIGDQYFTQGQLADPRFVRPDQDLRDAGVINGVDLTGYQNGNGPIAREASKALNRSQTSANYQNYQGYLNQLQSLSQQGIPGVQQYAQNESNRALTLRDQTQGTNAGLQQGVLQNLQNLQALANGSQVQGLNNTLAGNGLTLTPQLQAQIDREKALSIQNAETAARGNADVQESQIQAKLAARGLSGSTAATRASNDFNQNILNNIQTARNSAEQNAIQRQLGLVANNVTDRGNTIQGYLNTLNSLSGIQNTQGSLGLQNMGLNNEQLNQLTTQANTYNPAQQLSVIQQLLGAGYKPTGDFAQQQYTNELAALNPSGQTNANSSSGNALVGVAGQAAGSLLGAGAAALFSDKKLKKNIKTNDKDVSELLDTLKSYSYDYKSPKHGKGKQHGLMAQDLEKSKAGKSLIIETSEGKAVDTRKAALLSLSALSSLNNRLKKVEGK